MKALLISIIYTAARTYFKKYPGLFDRIEKFVIMLLNDKISGDEKRKQVREDVWTEWSHIRAAVIDAVITVVLMKQGKV